MTPGDTKDSVHHYRGSAQDEEKAQHEGARNDFHSCISGTRQRHHADQQQPNGKSCDDAET